MEKTVIAGIVAIAFILITSILFVARKKFSGLDIPATVSAIATVVTVIVFFFIAGRPFFTAPGASSSASNGTTPACRLSAV